MTGAEPEEIDMFINENLDHGFCNIDITYYGSNDLGQTAPNDLNDLGQTAPNAPNDLGQMKKLCIESRRFHREYERRKEWAKRQQKRRDKKKAEKAKKDIHGRVTEESRQSHDVSSTSTSTSTSNKRYKDLGQKRVKKPSLTQVAKDTQYEFDMWWEVWPKKVQKKVARKAYAKGRRDNNMPGVKELIDITHKHIEAWKERDDPRFIPHPSTWLNGCRWEDELEGGNDDAFDELRKRHQTPDGLVQKKA
jgi:hypothetical protein